MQPHDPFEFDGVELPNAGVLEGSLVLNTSILGLDLKKDVGLNETLSCSTGILQNTSVSITEDWKTQKATGSTYTGQSSGLGMWVVPLKASNSIPRQIGGGREILTNRQVN